MVAKSLASSPPLPRVSSSKCSNGKTNCLQLHLCIYILYIHALFNRSYNLLPCGGVKLVCGRSGAWSVFCVGPSFTILFDLLGKLTMSSLSSSVRCWVKNFIQLGHTVIALSLSLSLSISVHSIVYVPYVYSVIYVILIYMHA